MPARFYARVTKGSRAPCVSSRNERARRDILSTSASTSEPDDDALIASVARGDACAFRRLVERHAPSLFRLAYRLLGDAAEAEDIVQEALVRIWDRARGWTSYGGGITGWLRRTVTNLAIDRLRRAKRLSTDPVPERADSAPDAEAQAEEARLGALARQALMALPDRQRAAVVLTYYEELSNLAAAETLGMNIKAFESLLFRARAALRDALGAAGVTAADVGGR